MWKISSLLLWCMATVAIACRESSPRAEIVCYYDGLLRASLIDPCKCTILVISEVKVNSEFKLVSDLDFSALNELKKKNHDLKLIVSVGGRRVKPEVFVLAMASVEGIANFTEGVAAFVSEHSLDGVEINWRWPGMPRGLKNKDDLTSLMRVLRFALDDQPHNLTRREIELEPESGSPFSLLDIYDESEYKLLEEVSPSISSPLSESTQSSTTASSDQLTTPELISKTTEISSVKSSTTTTTTTTTTGDIASGINPDSFSYVDHEEIDPSVAAGPDYLLLDDYFLTSEMPDLETETNEEEENKWKDKNYGKPILTQEEKTQISKESENTKASSRGGIKFKDHFKESDIIRLEDVAKQQGAKGGWKIARKRIIGPAERIIRPLEKRVGSSKILILTISPRPEYIVKGYDLKALTSIVDAFSVPSDNLTANSITSGQNGSFTYHHSRLMGVSDIQNADSLIDLIVSMGVPLDRLILGVSTAGSLFTLRNTTENTPRSPARENPLWIPYRKVCSLLGEGNWTLERDDDLTGPYAYKDDKWTAFDDPISLRVKSKYALLRGLAGIGIKVVDDEDWTGVCSQVAFPLVTTVFETFTQLARTPRKAVLMGLVRDLETAESTIRASFEGSSTDLRISPFRIVRVIDKDGAIKAIRSNGDTRYECSRQGYYRDPDDCSRFYRCVKFNQNNDDYTIFEYSCPVGLVFDDRWEICAWPSTASPCDGSSEIFPVPRNKNVCNQEGYFTDPENCRWFYACKDYYGNNTFTHYEFRCPFGLAYDEENHICNWPWLVPICGESKPAIESKGQGKAIKSGRREQKFEEQKIKECVNCNEAEIKISGNGIFHPEKGIIVPTTYFDKVSELESKKISADQGKNLHLTSSKENKHASSLQNVQVNKHALGKETFGNQNINSDVQLEGKLHLGSKVTDNLHSHGRVKSGQNDSSKFGLENFNMENVANVKTSLSNENHALFISKRQKIKQSSATNVDGAVDEYRISEVSVNKGITKSKDFVNVDRKTETENPSHRPPIYDSSFALNNPAILKVQENIEGKSISSNKSPITHFKIDSDSHTNIRNSHFEQSGISTSNIKSTSDTKGNSFKDNSFTTNRFVTPISSGISHRLNVDKNSPLQAISKEEKQSNHFDSNNFKQFQHPLPQPIVDKGPARKSDDIVNINESNIKIKNSLRDEVSHFSSGNPSSQIKIDINPIHQRSSIDNKSEFTPVIGSSIISSLNYNDQNFESKHNSSPHVAGSITSNSKQQGSVSAPHISKHGNEGSIENAKMSKTSTLTASGTRSTGKAKSRGNSNNNKGEVVSQIDENSKFIGTVYDDSRLGNKQINILTSSSKPIRSKEVTNAVVSHNKALKSDSKSLESNVSTLYVGLKKQTTINGNSYGGSLEPRNQYNTRGKTIFVSSPWKSGTSMNRSTFKKNSEHENLDERKPEHVLNSRPILQSGTKEVLQLEQGYSSRLENESKSTSTIDLGENLKLKGSVSSPANSRAEKKSLILGDNFAHNKRLLGINVKTDSLQPGKTSTITISSTPIVQGKQRDSTVTLENKNTQRFDGGQRSGGIYKFGISSEKTEKLPQIRGLGYTQNSESGEILDVIKSFDQSSTSGGYKRIEEIPRGSVSQNIAENKGAGMHIGYGVNQEAGIRQDYGSHLGFKENTKSLGSLTHGITFGHGGNFEAKINSGDEKKLQQKSGLMQGIILSQVESEGRSLKNENRQIHKGKLNHESYGEDVNSNVKSRNLSVRGSSEHDHTSGQVNYFRQGTNLKHDLNSEHSLGQSSFGNKGSFKQNLRPDDVKGQGVIFENMQSFIHKESSKYNHVNDEKTSFELGSTSGHESNLGQQSNSKQISNMRQGNAFKQVDIFGQGNVEHVLNKGQGVTLGQTVEFIHVGGTGYGGGSVQIDNSRQREISGQGGNLKHERGFEQGKSSRQDNKSRSRGSLVQIDSVGQENIRLQTNNFKQDAHFETGDRVRQGSSSMPSSGVGNEHNNRQESKFEKYSNLEHIGTKKEPGSSLGKVGSLRSESSLLQESSLSQNSNIGHRGIKVQVVDSKAVDSYRKNRVSSISSDDVDASKIVNFQDKTTLSESLITDSSLTLKENSASNRHFGLGGHSGIGKNSLPNSSLGSTLGQNIGPGQSVSKVVPQFTESSRSGNNHFKSSAVNEETKLNLEQGRNREHGENYKPGFSRLPNVEKHEGITKQKSNIILNNNNSKATGNIFEENTLKSTGTNKNILPNSSVYNHIQGKSINPNANPKGPFNISNNNLQGFNVRKPVNSGPSLLAKFGNPTKFQRFGPGGFRDFNDNLGPEVCERAGLFRHPNSCDKFYECYWDRWIEKFTLHIFDCPVTIVYDSTITACNWPFNGPPCTED